MAGNRTIQILINALTNTKGFDDAQKGLVDLALQAKNAGVGMDNAGKSARHMGEEMGGKRGQVADLTRVILMQIGATQGAGEAAKLAGIGLNFMEGAASGLNIAMAAGTAALAFLLPLLIEWTSAGKSVEEQQKTVNDAVGVSLQQLQEYVEKVPNATQELRNLYQVMRDKAVLEQKTAIGDLDKSTSSLRTQIEQLLQPVMEIEAGFHRGGAQLVENKEATEANRKKAQELSSTLAEQTAQLNALLAAREDETTATEQVKSGLDDEDAARRKAAKALEDHKRAQEEYNRQLDEARKAAIPAMLKELAPLLEKDSKALHDLEQENNLGQLSQGLFDLLTTAPGPAEETGTALRNLGFDLAQLQGRLEDVDQAFFEAQDMFAQGLISPETLAKANQAILQTIDNLREAGVAVQSPFTKAQEVMLTIQQDLVGGLLQAGNQFADTFASALVGMKVNWKQFAQQVIKDLIAMLLKALAFRAVMDFIGIASGGAGTAVAGAGGLGGISLGGGVFGAASGGIVTGGKPGLDSVLALLAPGEIVLPASLSRQFEDFSDQAGGGARAGRSVPLGPEMAMAIQIMPKRDRQREAAELIDDINELVERKGYRLTATKLTS